MRVTKSSERDDLTGLKVLAMVLNFDFEASSARDLERLKRLSPYDFANVESVLTKGDPDEKKRANGIRAELRADLESVIAPEGKVSADEAFLRIHKLLEKISKIESKTVWGVEPAEEAEDAHDTTWYWTSRSTVELLGYKWFVGLEGEEVDGTFSRDQLYLKIRDAFQIGVFDRLRICPHCKEFFVAEDDRKQFCSGKHRNQFNNTQRLESGWFKDRRGRKRKRDLALARKLLREGKSATQIAKETKLSLRVLKRERIIP